MSGLRDLGERVWLTLRVVGALSEPAKGLLALLFARALQDQHAVEMVDLVLDHSRIETGGLDQKVLSDLVVRPNPNVDRALDVDDHARQAQAAFLGYLVFLGCPLDDGIYERDKRRVRSRAVDQH